MTAGSGPYLVTRREDGYGDVYPLQAGQRMTLGRANSNRIILKDELCSREHAEVYFAAGRWHLRDLKSLNGTRVGDDPLLDVDWELSPGDEFQVGKTRFVFVETLEQLPSVARGRAARSPQGLSIKKRLGQTRFMTPVPDDETAAASDAPQVGARAS